MLVSLTYLLPELHDVNNTKYFDTLNKPSKTVTFH